MKVLIIAVALTAAGIYLLWSMPESVAPQPLAICLLQDVGETAPQNGVPLLSRDDFEKLIALASRSGGEIGFGLISEVDEPLARLRVSAVMNPYQKNRLRNQAGTFREEVRTRLSRGLSPKTDIVAAMNRANTFLEEINSKNRFLIVVSDGVHNANRDKLPTPNPGVQTLIVGGKRRPNLPSARYHESIGAAVEYIQSQQQGASHHDSK